MGLVRWAGVCGVLEVGVESVCGVGLVCWAGGSVVSRVERGLCAGRECAGLWRLGWGAWAADAGPGLFANV